MTLNEILERVDKGHFQAVVHLNNEWKSEGLLISIDYKMVVVGQEDGSFEMINMENVVFCKLIPISSKHPSLTPEPTEDLEMLKKTAGKDL